MISLRVVLSEIPPKRIAVPGTTESGLAMNELRRSGVHLPPKLRNAAE
jgi:hypothetical protein